MSSIGKMTVDFNQVSGVIKPMNAVNNGPYGSEVRKTGNFSDYKELHIPFARLHDAAFFADDRKYERRTYI